MGAFWAVRVLLNWVLDSTAVAVGGRLTLVGRLELLMALRLAVELVLG